ncbi:protein of unknown function [Candidatus Hydrogenisulfobacillus filiaventi]|uniref:Uncharacterized protein n=1 Tax=Candidatus Hydrogenisulfobacillus filiaventi TaxID=2707344 RepID=A0A6F8ZHS9_9FIRM|nr:protein of unknown function [Candidatus Hydrogenisulfobacillus filiaventi]
MQRPKRDVRRSQRRPDGAGPLQIGVQDPPPDLSHRLSFRPAVDHPHRHHTPRLPRRFRVGHHRRRLVEHPTFGAICQRFGLWVSDRIAKDPFLRTSGRPDPPGSARFGPVSGGNDPNGPRGVPISCGILRRHTTYGGDRHESGRRLPGSLGLAGPGEQQHGLQSAGT